MFLELWVFIEILKELLDQHGAMLAYRFFLSVENVNGTEVRCCQGAKDGINTIDRE